MAGRSPFEELLAEGRRQLDAMTGRRGDPAPSRDPVGEPAPQAPRAIQGTVRGIPFRLNLPRADRR